MLDLQVWIFSLVDDDIFDSICERLRPEIHITGSEIFYHGGLVEKMVFIIRGKLESIGDGIVIPLYEGGVCGKELLTCYLEHTGGVNRDGNKFRIGTQLCSSRTVTRLTHVETFSLRAADLEQVTQRFGRNFRNPRIQGAIRYQSTYWRSMAASRIQVARRYRQQCLKYFNSSLNRSLN